MVCIVVVVAGCQTQIDDEPRQSVVSSDFVSRVETQEVVIPCQVSLERLQEFGYTGTITKQDDQCMVTGQVYYFDIPHLGIGISFGQTYSVLFLDQSKHPSITVRDNMVTYDADHNVVVS